MDRVTEFSEVKVDRKCRQRTVDEKRQIEEETLSSEDIVTQRTLINELMISFLGHTIWL